MRTAVLVDAIRTGSGRGKPGGALSPVHPTDLFADVIKSLVARHDFDPSMIDDVIGGCVLQAREQAGNITRNALLSAGLPSSVPGTTIDRQCGSSQQAVQFAAQGIAAGGYDIAIAGGVESMSRVPMGTNRMGVDQIGALGHDRYPEGLVSQGVSAELIARHWGLGRDALDAFSARSHELADSAACRGAFAREIVALDVDGVAHDSDETVRAGTSVTGLSGLPPSFASDEMKARFPHVTWSITPGNSSPLTDGASASLIMEESVAQSLGLRPRARFVAFSVIGDDPIMMLTGPIPATRRVLERAGLRLDDIDVFEVNEAFASVPLMWAAEFHVDEERINPRGGAIALGHPMGASGTRILATMLHFLEDTGGRYGLQVMCEGGGMANAMIIERL